MKIGPPETDECIYDYEPHPKQTMSWALGINSWKCSECGVINCAGNEFCVYCRLRKGILNARPNAI